MLTEGNNFTLLITLSTHDFNSGDPVSKFQSGFKTVGQTTIDSGFLNKSIDNNVDAVILVSSKLVALFQKLRNVYDLLINSSARIALSK